MIVLSDWVLMALLVIGVVGFLLREHAKTQRAWCELEQELMALYGEEQIKGLTAREVYLLIRAGVLHPLREPHGT